MKYIKVNDTMYQQYHDSDCSFIVAVDENEYELLKTDLYQILDNQEDYEDPGVYESMMKVIREHGASIIEPDFNMDW